MNYKTWLGLAFSLVCITSITMLAQKPTAGTLDDAVPFIEIPIRIDDEGVTLTLDVQTIRGDLDPLLYLVDERSAIVAENDDRTKGDPNPLIEFVEAPIGDYTIVVTRFGIEEGTTSGDFELTVTQTPPIENTTFEYDVSPETLERVGYPKVDPKPKADWVIIAYFGGDSNLEPGVMNDFNELELAGGSDETVRVVALLDRHPEFVTNSGNWRSARIFEIQADVSKDEGVVFPPTLDTEPIVDLGVLDTGDGNTLAQFLTWATQSYPAEHYAIALASHGGAWQGVITDDTNGNTILTLPELDEAFRIAREQAQVERFDLLINDACLMSSVEYHDVLADDFTYSIASPEIVVDPALDMDLLLSSLRDKPNQSITTLSSALINRYLTDTSASDRADKDYLSYALTDLRQYPDVIEAVENFASYINDNPLGTSNLIGIARSKSYVYSRFLGDDDQIDLGDFMHQVIDNTTNPELIERANAVIEALQGAEIYGKSAPRVADRISFYNIYFPQDGANFKDGYLTVSPLKEWGRMLRTYYSVSAPRLWRVDNSALAYHPPVAPSVSVTRVYPVQSSTISPPTISVEIVGRRTASGSFTIDRIEDDGSLTRLAQTSIVTAVQNDNSVTFENAWQSGVDHSVFQWLPFELPTVTDGTNTYYELMTLQGNVASLDGQYRLKGTNDWYDVTVLFSPNGTIENVISQTITGAVADVTIPPRSDFRSFRTIVAPNGTTKQIIGNSYFWTDKGLTWQSSPTPDGKYQLGFLVQAFGGAIGFDAVDIQVVNNQQVVDQRGYTDINLGINFQVGADWTPVVDYGNYLHTNNPDNTLAVNVYHFAAQENVYEIVEEAIKRFGLVATSELLNLTYRGNAGVYFDYTYAYTTGEKWRGRAIAFYHPTLEGGQGIVYGVEGQISKDATDPTALFRQQLNTLVFINADALRQEDTSQWQYQLLNGVIPYPAPKNWVTYEQINGTPWTLLTPPNGFNGLTLAYLGKVNGDNAELAVQDVFDEYVTDADDSQTRLYRSETHDWYSIAYTATRTTKNELGRIVDVNLIGRIYVTELNGDLYAWRFEAPSETATAILRNVFEPMVDGFAPTVNFNTLSKTTLQKLIALAEAVDCQDLDWNVVCASGGAIDTVTPQGVSATKPNKSLLNLANYESISLSAKNPTAVAILNLQANLPDRNAGEYLRVYGFGGVTIANDASPFPTLQVVNNHTTTLAIRELPDVSAKQVGSLTPEALADAIAISEDGDWIRVRIPMNEGMSGWIRAEFLAPVQPEETFENLAIGDPAQPPYYLYQSLDVSFDEQGGIFRGLILQTPDTKETLYLRINGQLYEIAGGASLIWSADTQALESAGTASSEDVLAVVDDARVPEPLTPTPTQIAPERIPVTATPKNS